MTLHFAAPRSLLHPSFWDTVCEKKLSIWKLNQNPVGIVTQVIPSDGQAQGSFMFSGDSLTSSQEGLSVYGHLQVVNSLEEFKEFDKLGFVQQCGHKLFQEMLHRNDLSAADLITPFLLVYADLKNQYHTYWMCVPVLVPLNSPFVRFSRVDIPSPVLKAVYETIYSKVQLASVAIFDSLSNRFNMFELEDGLTNVVESLSTSYIVCIDQGYDAILGWSSRNVLLYAALRMLRSEVEVDPISGEFTFNVLLLRNSIFKFASSPQSHSLDDYVASDRSIAITVTVSSTDLSAIAYEMESMEEFRKVFNTVGWESNERGKPGPRHVSARTSEDSSSMIRQAGDLNLKLMKWRLWPDLKVETIQQTRCLLFGAGTLGCSVARALLGYGVRTITLVDNGRVSYSNPARQCLYTEEDAVKGVFKALAASQRLLEINSSLNVRGEVISIPMPGHPFASNSKVPADPLTCESQTPVYSDGAAVLRLDELVKEHDCVFVLTDSREARWLPTVLCRLHKKLCINVALGFDSLLVMHQCPPRGCYFCNDLAAAGNSQRRRAIDEQCTITRPGLSFMAAGLGVGLMVQILQNGVVQNTSEWCDVVPHQIRTSLLDASQIVLHTPTFEQCTACSDPVVAAFAHDPVAFVQQVCSHPEELEKISGARELIESVDVDACMLSDSGDDF